MLGRIDLIFFRRDKLWGHHPLPMVTFISL